MRFLSHSCLIAGSLLIVAGSASAHSFSAAPVHIHSSYHSNARGYAGHAGHPSFFARLFGLGDVSDIYVEPYASSPYVGAVGYGDDARPPAEYVPVKVQSDEERYRSATGLTLPPLHGLEIVPPTSSDRDVTYIWANDQAG